MTVVEIVEKVIEQFRKSHPDRILSDILWLKWWGVEGIESQRFGVLLLACLHNTGLSAPADMEIFFCVDAVHKDPTTPIYQGNTLS